MQVAFGRDTPRMTRSLRSIALGLIVLLPCACGPAPTPATATDPTPRAQAATKPAQAVRELTAHLRANDLEAFANAAVPPAVHARLQQAWREGRTRWPLDEFPFGRKLPSMLGALARPGSETQLQAIFDRQFAGAGPELNKAATSLGLFGAQFIEREGDYSEDEREHYAQLVAAASDWGSRAPLADRQRAKVALVTLAAAARRTGLATEDDFRKAGMDASLRRIAGFSAAVKQVLRRYGLDLDADLDTLDATLVQQTGDHARVRMRYRFAGSDIDTLVALQRIDGRWYLDDLLRHAEAAVAPAAASPAARR